MKETSQSVSGQGFSYLAFWEAQDMLQPRAGRSQSGDEGKVSLIPVVPIRTAVQRIEQSFPLEDLRDEEIQLEELLIHHTAAEVEDFLEAQGFERCVGLEEVERLIEQQTLGVIRFTCMDLPIFSPTLEMINGKLVDVSAFNTNDFAAQAPRPTPAALRANSVRRRCRDLAILHAVIHDEAARQTLRQRLHALRPRCGLA